MYRQVFDGTTAQRSDDIGAPAVFCETVRQPRRKGKGGIAPQVMLVGCGNTFFVIKSLHGFGFSTVGQAQQKARQGQGNVTRILGLPEGLPFDVLGAFKNRF